MVRALALACCLAGCYSPRPPAGAPCANGVCPEGLVCSPATLTCELHATDARVADGIVRDAALGDAARDAAPADAAMVGPQLVQQKINTTPAGVSLSVTLNTPPVNGDVLVMIGGDPQASLTSVTGGGATWTRAAASTVNANLEIWFGVSDGSSSTVTIALTSSTSSMTMHVSEWSGLATANTLDGSSSAAGTSSPASAGPITTTHAHDLVLFGVGDFYPNAFGTPLGMTPLLPVPGVATGISQGEWYRVATATGTFAPSVTETAHAWDAAVVALRVAP